MSENHEAASESVATPSKAAAKPKQFLGVRHLQVTLAFFNMLITYTQRVNLSVAIVAMVDKKNANPDWPEYDWNLETQSTILSGFLWGYVILQVPGGLLAERFGPKIVITVATLVTSWFCMLIPLGAARGGWGLVFAFRFMQGLGQGMLLPGTHALLAKWVPVEERGWLVTLAYSGVHVGTLLGMTMSGILSSKISSVGWPSAFYVFGGLGIVWTLLWIFLGADTPATDRFISEQERAYIEDSLHNKENTNGKTLATPWKAMMTSLPVWAIIVAHSGWGWGFWTLLTELPTFLESVLGHDIKSNGLLSALPYLVVFVLSLVFSKVSEFLINRKILSVTASRKTFNTISSVVPAAALIGLSYAEDKALAIVLLCIAVGVSAAAFVGYLVNHIDLAPNFAATLMGLSNSTASLISCFGPLVVGFFVEDESSSSQWRIIFFIAAAVYFFTGLFYAVFASSELQQWNDPPEDAHAQEYDVRRVSANEPPELSCNDNQTFEN